MSEPDIEIARVAQRCIVRALDPSRVATITVTPDAGEQPSIAVPPAALKLIGQLLGAMSEGRTITLVPSKRELSTVEVANFLNVSRPFVIKEIEKGCLPHRKIGTHRRVAFEDLQACARSMRQNQSAALDRMAANARELGLEYRWRGTHATRHCRTRACRGRRSRCVQFAASPSTSSITVFMRLIRAW